MPAPVGYTTNIPRSKTSAETKSVPPQQDYSNYAPSTMSEADTRYSYDKAEVDADTSQQSESSQTKSKPKKSKGSWRQRIKESLKEVGYPPTYHHDMMRQAEASDSKSKKVKGIPGSSPLASPQHGKI
ncbi:hypothetical protein QBC46DRAFT_412048 [Diplogelasinospora grovesii]|uniref:Uncharacterized protein n=1 Tax=Diplogelasinospora grovesii TaxID=303347 RepID=A0AAN6MZP5_9PEZI|nr:hypothetical protein QBC46DRAFT_412048 [Diplogelasinospora grovesii]